MRAFPQGSSFSSPPHNGIRPGWLAPLKSGCFVSMFVHLVAFRWQSFDIVNVQSSLHGHFTWNSSLKCCECKRYFLSNSWTIFLLLWSFWTSTPNGQTNKQTWIVIATEIRQWRICECVTSGIHCSTWCFRDSSAVSRTTGFPIGTSQDSCESMYWYELPPRGCR